MRRTRWAAPVVAIALAISGCASTRSGTVAPPALSARPGQVVFSITDGPGFTSLNVALAVRPKVTVYGNGDAYVTTRDDDRYWAGGPVAVRKGTVPAATLRALVQDARDAGLSGHADYGTPAISDAGATSFTFRPDRGRRHTVSVYALDAVGDDGLTSDQQARRAALLDFEHRLLDSVTDTTAWTPSRLDVTAVGDVGVPVDGTLTPWPGAPLEGLLTAHQRGRCGALSAADGRAVYRTARAHPDTSWIDHGKTYALVLRALLPQEVPCH